MDCWLLAVILYHRISIPRLPLFSFPFDMMSYIDTLLCDWIYTTWLQHNLLHVVLNLCMHVMLDTSFCFLYLYDVGTQSAFETINGISGCYPNGQQQLVSRHWFLNFVVLCIHAYLINLFGLCLELAYLLILLCEAYFDLRMEVLFLCPPAESVL